MSGEGTHSVPEPGSHHGENGRTNSGFDVPLQTVTNTYSHGGSDQRTDWPKEVDKMMEDFLSRCPGTYGGSEQPSSRGQTTEHFNTPVCYLLVFS